VITQKGKGLDFAAQDPVTWHGARPYFVQGHKATTIGREIRPPYTEVIRDEIVAAAKEDERIVAITAAMAEGTGLTKFQKEFPDRYFDVGICEPHAVTFAAGLATRGVKPFVCIYSAFMQRSFDMLMHDISLQGGLPVVVCLDRAGLVGDDGPTHHGVLDIAFSRILPHFIVAAPKDGAEAKAFIRWAEKQEKPTVLRYPRCAVPDETGGPPQPIELGRGEILREGEGTALLAYGSEVSEALSAADILRRDHGKNVTVANARFAKPLDVELLERLLKNHDRILTVEEHVLAGGFGAAVLEEASSHGWGIQKIACLAVPDRFVPHARRSRQLEMCGLDAEGIVTAVLEGKQAGSQ
jgi:1-deoxy-D-xylulose-5-phosphate synthase